MIFYYILIKVTSHKKDTKRNDIDYYINSTLHHHQIITITTMCHSLRVNNHSFFIINFNLVLFISFFDWKMQIL